MATVGSLARPARAVTVRPLAWVRYALWAQALLALVVGAGYLTASPGFAAGEPVAGRKAAAFLFAFAFTLVLVSRTYAEDRRWLLVPAVIVALNLADTLYEFFGRGDRNFVPPLVLEPVFLAIWVYAYLRLGAASAPSAAHLG